MKSYRKSKLNHNPRRLSIQKLEERRLLAICPHLSQTYDVYGGDVTISDVKENSRSVIRINELTIDPSCIRRINVYGGSGPNNFRSTTDLVSVYMYGRNGNDTLSGGYHMDGGAGNDRISVDGRVDAVFGGPGHDTILGSRRAERLKGGSGNDTIRGGAGDDELFGEEGNDQLYGGSGDDEIYGGGGNDRLFGEAGDDGLDGGTGSDALNYGRSSLSISDVSANEGNRGESASFDFRVALDTEDRDVSVRVDYATDEGSADNPSDFAKKNGTLHLSGAMHLNRDAMIRVRVNGDWNPESNEQFRVVLSNPANAEIIDDVGVGTIINDDNSPTPKNDAVTIRENDGETSIDVLANDVDPDGDRLGIDISTKPQAWNCVNSSKSNCLCSASQSIGNGHRCLPGK